VPARRVQGPARVEPAQTGGHTEFRRGILERDAAGDLVVRATGQQGSGILHSMSAGNCFVILPRDSAGVEPGTLVDVQPFHGIL